MRRTEKYYRRARTAARLQEACVSKCYSTGTMDRLLDLLMGRDASVQLDRAALELASIEFPELDIEGFVGVLDSYAAELRERVIDADGPAYIREANRYLFEELGFRGNSSTSGPGTRRHV